jgi:SAM-dependent methyltransferase
MHNAPMQELLDARYETVGCLCGSGRRSASRVVAEDARSGEHFGYLRCAECGLERLNPRPHMDRIGAYYSDTYAPYIGAVPKGRAEAIKRLIYEVFWTDGEAGSEFARRHRGVLRVLLRPLRHRAILAFRAPPIRRIFEFGAAKGTDLLAFRDAGWQVEGCDPSPLAVATALDHNIVIQHAPAEDAMLEDGRYGAILFNNVFEHLHYPQDVLRKCRAALCADGALIIVVPNHDSLAGRLFRGAWPGYDAPRHIWGWTPHSLARLLEDAGFTVEHTHQQITGLWLWRSTLDMRHAPGRPGALRRWLAHHAPFVMLPISALGLLLGRADFMKIVARRAP